jgi:sigma-E factor negative regulatory protein RseA
MNEELDSQLSAMFDDELPAAECELMARRLSRDEDLKSRWSRYAAIGATIRSEGGVRLNSTLAARVNAVLTAEPPTTITEPVPVAVEERQRPRPRVFASRWWAPVGGVAVAASVAAAAILWVRFESPAQDGQILASRAGANGGPVAVATNTPDSYVVPKTLPRRSIVPSTQLANYVVAHSEFSSPVSRRNLLSALMASESGTAAGQTGSDEPTEDVNDDAKSPQ